MNCMYRSNFIYGGSILQFFFLNKHISPAIPQKSTQKIQDLKVSHVYPNSTLRNSCNKSDLTAEQAKNFANLGKFRAILRDAPPYLENRYIERLEG